MKPKLIIVTLLIHSFFGKALADISLTEKKSSGGKRYLEYMIPESEGNGVYKIWNLTQNKQVGNDIRKSTNEESDVVVFEGSPGDKYTILDSSGSVVATYVDSGKIEARPEISGKKMTATSNEGIKKKNASDDSSILKRVHTGDDVKESAEDQIGYIKALKASHQDVVNQLRHRLKVANKKIRVLLKNNSDKEVTQKCATAKIDGSSNKTMAVASNCQDINELSKAEGQASSTLSKVEKYEQQIMGELVTSPKAAEVPINSAATSTPVSNSSSCMKVKAKDYVQFRLFSSYILPGKGLEDEISVPPSDNRTIPNSTLWSKKETDPTSQAYRDDKDLFLDRCNPWEPKDYSTYSEALSKYKKVYGVRRADFFCLDGVTKPARFTVDPFRSHFSYEGDHQISCPDHDGVDYKVTCSPPDSWRFQKVLKGEIYTQDLYDIHGWEVPGAPYKRTGDASKDISELEVYRQVYCKENNKIYWVFRTPLLECGKGYIGQGHDVYKDWSQQIKSMLKGPFGVASTYEEALTKYKNCSDYKVDISKAIDGDKEIRYDGLFVSAESNEEFMVEEHQGIGKISISSLYRNAHYKSLVTKNSQGSFIGKGVDYPGTCLEIVPFDQTVERISNTELKVIHTVKEDSCTFKVGSTFVMTLKKKH